MKKDKLEIENYILSSQETRRHQKIIRKIKEERKNEQSNKREI